MTTSPDSLLWADPEAASARVGELYEAHGRMVVGLCRFLLRDPIEAEDAAQQSFVAAHSSLLRGSVPRDAPAWLATIARNECRARIKQRMREPLPLYEPDGLEGELPDPFHAAVKNADLKAVRAGLEALPQAQRNAFVLREFAGLSYNELSCALGVSEPAVESLLVRARTKLRLALAHANPLVVPLVLRDQLARLTTCWDDGSAGAVAKLATLPIAAKLAAMGTSAALVVVGGTGVERIGAGHRVISSRQSPVTAPTVERSVPAVNGRSGSSRTTLRLSARLTASPRTYGDGAYADGATGDHSGRATSGRDDASFVTDSRPDSSSGDSGPDGGDNSSLGSESKPVPVPAGADPPRSDDSSQRSAASADGSSVSEETGASSGDASRRGNVSRSAEDGSASRPASINTVSIDSGSRPSDSGSEPTGSGDTTSATGQSLSSDGHGSDGKPSDSSGSGGDGGSQGG